MMMLMITLATERVFPLLSLYQLFTSSHTHKEHVSIPN